MAGIGFELKRLFKNKGLFSSIRAYAYSALVSLGPFILCTIIIAAILIFSSYMNIAYRDRELFIATIVYAFIFSQIISSGFKMVITRFIADMLYKQKHEYILPSLYGVLSIVIVFAGTAGILFYYRSPLPFAVKLVSYLLYMELIIVFIMMEYLSTIKDYMRIVKSFISGVIASVCLSYVFLKFTALNTVFSLIFAMNIGFLIIIAILMAYLRSFYGRPARRYFDFLIYFEKYPSLFFISFFYTLGLYSHNFLFWASRFGVEIGGTYTYAPTYDVPTFYAFLSVMPSMVIFIVSVETSFYEKYRTYYSLITGKGNFSDIENARQDMTRVLWSEIRNIMELQLFFTLVFIAAGFYVLPRFGLSQLSMDIFNLIALGAYLNIMVMIVILILLYFENRSGALFVAVIFLLSNAGFTFMTLMYSESIYGVGFFASSIFSLIIALIELSAYLKNINYYTFCSQPVIYKERIGIFGKMINFFASRNKA
ncbi:MAG: hypothetical protein FJW69_01470 [Actinobacteria bacterium]|nr:hypothetical protein [Actinomycetota bacterium]MBM3712413.1 hypothetical protein [Actinomycetota bacterium]